MQDTNQQPDVPVIYLKPTRFDFVLEGVAVLLLLALWAVVLGSFVFPDWYPERFDQSGGMVVAIMMTFSVVIICRRVRLLEPMESTLVTITEENAERQCRLFTRLWQYLLIVMLLMFLEISLRGFLPGRYVGISACLFLWYIIRSRMLK